MAPIIGKASIAYLPRDKLVRIGKLARVLHGGFARRLQVRAADRAGCGHDLGIISSQRASQ